MDAVEIGTIVGVALSVLGSGGAFVTARRAQDHEDPEVPKLRARISELEKENGKREEQNDALQKRLDKAEGRLALMVTDEEFAAYTAHTTDALMGLKEKVGRVSGALEAWAQHHERNR